MSIALKDFFDGKALIPYLAQRPTDAYIGESVFPYFPTDELSYEHIVGTYKRPIMASFVAFGDEGVIRGRDGVSKFIEKLRPIKQFMTLDGELFIRYRTAQNVDPLVRALFDDVGMVYDGVRARLEAMRIQILTTGKLKVDENKIKFTVDYGVPAANKKTPTTLWSDTTNADPIANMIDWKMALDFVPVGGIVSQTTAKYLLTNKNVKTMINGSDKALTPISMSTLNSFLVQNDLPPLVVNIDKYRDDTLSERKFWPENIMTWVGSDIGNTLMGPTEESVLGKGIVRAENGIYVQVHEQEKPPAIVSTGTTTSLVAFPGASNVLIVTTH